MDSFGRCSGLEFMTPAMFRDLLVNYLKTRREPRAQHVGGVDHLTGELLWGEWDDWENRWFPVSIFPIKPIQEWDDSPLNPSAPVSLSTRVTPTSSNIDLVHIALPCALSL